MTEIVRTVFLVFLCLIVCFAGYVSLTAKFPNSIGVLELDKLNPGLVTSIGSLSFFNGSDNSAILFEGDQWKADRVLRLNIDSGGFAQPSLTLRLNESLPEDAQLQILWRSEGTPDRVRIDISDVPESSSPSQMGETSYLTTVTPAENWISSSWPLSQFKRIHPKKSLQPSDSPAAVRNVRFVRFTFFPQSRSTLEIGEVRFVWRSFRWNSLLVCIIVIFIGILLWARTTRENVFERGGHILNPNSLVARGVYAMVVVAVMFAVTGQSMISGDRWPFLTFSALAALILFDDFIKSGWTRSRFWTYRYLAIITCAWYFNITHNVTLLSFFLVIAMLPMIFVKSQAMLFSFPFLAVVGFVTHPQIAFRMAAVSGLIPIVSATVVILLIREIYEREMAKRETRYVRSLYEEVLENTSDCIYILDQEGRIIAANRGFELLVEYPGSEIIGRYIRDFVHENDASLIENERDAVPASEITRNYDLRFRQKSGGIRTALIRERAVAKDRFSTEYQVIATDITERKHAEAEREKLVEELQNMLAEIRMLSGLLPICASCKKIRDDKGYWTQLEAYIQAHTDARFTHGICPECMRELYPDIADEILGARLDDKAE